eukprot:766164-Hanusia_phi.AAC.1
MKDSQLCQRDEDFILKFGTRTKCKGTDRGLSDTIKQLFFGSEYDEKARLSTAQTVQEALVRQDLEKRLEEEKIEVHFIFLSQSLINVDEQEKKYLEETVFGVTVNLIQAKKSKQEARLLLSGWILLKGKEGILNYRRELEKISFWPSTISGCIIFERIWTTGYKLVSAVKICERDGDYSVNVDPLSDGRWWAVARHSASKRTDNLNLKQSIASRYLQKWFWHWIKLLQGSIGYHNGVLYTIAYHKFVTKALKGMLELWFSLVKRRNVLISAVEFSHQTFRSNLRKRCAILPNSCCSLSQYAFELRQKVIADDVEFLCKEKFDDAEI